VVATVLSADPEEMCDIPAFIGASAALTLSPLPFLGPIAAVRVGRIDGELMVNPKYSQLPESELDLIVAGSRASLVMVEGRANDVPEAEVLEALKYAHGQIVELLGPQETLRERVGQPKLEPTPERADEDLERQVRAAAEDRLGQAVRITAKAERYKEIGAIESEIQERFTDEYRKQKAQLDSLEAVEARQEGLRTLSRGVRGILHDIRSQLIRRMVLKDGKRIDARGTDEVRPIACEVGVAPRAHGSGLFTRGETQAIVYTTLGSRSDEQLIESLNERHYKNFMLHYNFPPFSVGEARFLRGPSRRDIGHGTLAERAIKPVLPPHDEFPYTVRIVSEVLESNGSSSMATVCGATLSLLDSGVKIKAPVAGIAMGLIQEGSEVAILSDILGDEDHLGDMDFKVAGTRNGITALQMDIKIRSVDWEVMARALEQACAGRLHILDCMEQEVRGELGELKPREELSRYAPRVEIVSVSPDKIRDIIGPGGKVIRAIQETTESKIDIEDSGQVTIFARDYDACMRARKMVEELTQEAEIGRVYLAKVKRVTDFGAFAEIFPGTDGLIHISHLAEGRVDKVEDVCVEGDEVLAKCIDIDPNGRVRLSRKEALADAAAQAAS
jgi:polyribonucleotide nucleotidyltransferase